MFRVSSIASIGATFNLYPNAAVKAGSRLAEWQHEE